MKITNNNSKIRKLPVNTQNNKHYEKLQTKFKNDWIYSKYENNQHDSRNSKLPIITIGIHKNYWILPRKNENYW